MPVDRGAIDAQLREIGEGERWWEQREFRGLPYILHADERILGLVSGKLLASRLPRIRPTGPWLFVATDQRLLCLKQDRFARRQVDFAPGQITRVQQSSRLRSFQITVETPQGRYRLRIPKEEAFRFVGALAPLMPRQPALDPAVEAFSWIPGMTTVASLPGVAGIVSKVSMLSPPDPPGRDRLERLEDTVERLQNDVERLQQQVAFLESLLQTRADQAVLPQPAADS